MYMETETNNISSILGTPERVYDVNRSSEESRHQFAEPFFLHTPGRPFDSITRPAISLFQSKNMDVDAKLDQILLNNSTLEHNVDKLAQSVEDLNSKFEKSNFQDNSAIRQHLLNTQGQVLRLQSNQKRLEQKVLSLEERDMRKSVVFYNIAEIENETLIKLRNRVYNVFLHEMQIPKEFIYSPHNLFGELRIDFCRRVGRFNPKSPRPVVVDILTRMGKDIVLDRRFIKALRNSPDKIRISENYPSEIRERRAAQIDTLKLVRTQKENIKAKVVLVSDKITINGKPYQDNNFEQSPLPYSTPFAINFADFNHSDTKNEKGSLFQGHAATVTNTLQASAMRNSIMSIPELAEAEHIIYAYRIKNEDDTYQSGFSDDLENCAGKRLKLLLEQNNAENICVCVTRIKTGGNIGRIRFQIINDVAQDALLSQTIEPKPESSELYQKL